MVLDGNDISPSAGIGRGLALLRNFMVRYVEAIILLINRPLVGQTFLSHRAWLSRQNLMALFITAFLLWNHEPPAVLEMHASVEQLCSPEDINRTADVLLQIRQITVNTSQLRLSKHPKEISHPDF